MILNINTDAAVQFTAKLEQMHRSALPNAIRNTLNSAAFDVKQKTMPQHADAEFVKRSPNFFKATSRVTMAKGDNMSGMKSEVGFDSKYSRANKYAVEELQQQEHGGVIDKRTFVPLRTARKGNNEKAMIRPNARLSKINNIINAKNSRGHNQKEKFIKAAIVAGKGGYVIGGRKQILFKVDSYVSDIRTGKTSLKVTPLYKFKKRGKVKVDGTGFMEKATKQSANKLEHFYAIEAKKQFARLKK
jgi:hypothetical protein